MIAADARKNQGHYDDAACEEMEAVIDLALNLGDKRTATKAAALLTTLDLGRGVTARVTERVRQLLAQAGETQDDHTLGLAACSLGDLARTEGEWDAAVAHYQTALAAFARFNDTVGIATTTIRLGKNAEERAIPRSREPTTAKPWRLRWRTTARAIRSAAWWAWRMWPGGKANATRRGAGWRICAPCWPSSPRCSPPPTVCSTNGWWTRWENSEEITSKVSPSKRGEWQRTRAITERERDITIRLNFAIMRRSTRRPITPTPRRCSRPCPS